ncbi:hypothetical protein C8J56DRAFT_1164384 [Mycena floridula]|nr:hypothetical protein C8J56DRAFT_1164384 [Mycena floridula]
MAQFLTWPGKYFYYPIGNTAAICLTRDIAPEDSAKILLLGCGDPRNVLNTIYNEPENSTRNLDFTCCDIDPAVLARNVLLFTMAIDKIPMLMIWNIFFHMNLDQRSHDALVTQCEKLLDISQNMEHWRASSYGPFLTFCTGYTLAELRRHWKLYTAFKSLPQQRQKTIRDAFSKMAKNSPLTKAGINRVSARSTGPLMVQASVVLDKMVRKYWTTGVTDANPSPSATLLNPTFVYSLGGEGCCVHYGTDPMTPFHLADLFGNAKREVTASDVVKAARKQFSDWCSSYASSVSADAVKPPVIRFFAGEATAVCSALTIFTAGKNVKTGVPVAQFNANLIELDANQYLSGNAPAMFTIIDTSNLADHVGLFNVMVSSVSVLEESRFSVLYTETLLVHGEDATKEFIDRLYADIPVMALLLRICPIDYLSRFVSRSNTHELMLHGAVKTKTKTISMTQFHSQMTWKLAISGDDLASNSSTIPVFDPDQLGTLLWDIYHEMFEQEDSRTFTERHGGQNSMAFAKAIASSNILHYTRGTFVAFFRLVKSKLNMSDSAWNAVMDRFNNLQAADISMPMDTTNRHDLFTQMHLHNVYTTHYYRIPMMKIGRFAKWSKSPYVVRVILTVPREKLAVLGTPNPLDSMGEGTTTIPMECHVRGVMTHNSFSSVHVAFGRVSSVGTAAEPKVVFEEDKEGWRGTSPLVASFTMSAQLLTAEPLENIKVHLAVRSTMGTVEFVKKLGLTLSVFGASILDENAVHLLPEPTLPIRSFIPSLPSRPSRGKRQIGESRDVAVELDEECELVLTLCGKIGVSTEKAKKLFTVDRLVPEITQISPCVMRLTLGDCVQDVIFPFPIAGEQQRLRLARKSLYIEVIVPPSGPFLADVMKVKPFPVVTSSSDTALVPWNIHRVNLTRLPLLNCKANIKEWLNSHLALAMSARERSLRKKHDVDTLMFVKDSLHAILVHSSGIQSEGTRRLFALRDKGTNNCDTILFISDLRYDVDSHTIVGDGYVLPLTTIFIARNDKAFTKLVHTGGLTNIEIDEGEMIAWKHLLSAFTERCRTWTHGLNCEYRASGNIPLTEKMEIVPLCSCGRGKDVEGMSKVDLWRPFAPYVTRMALSPLFAVSYLERVIRDPASRRCHVCRARGKPKLQQCITCKKVRYCSRECQKKDWNKHKVKCSATNS